MTSGQGQRAPKPAASGQGEDRPPNNSIVIAIGTVVILGIGVALIASLINLWPSVDALTTSAGVKSTATHTVRLFFAAISVQVRPSTALLLMVVIVGALGSLIHAATSFADFVGNRRFYSSWAVWYLVRLVVGSSLAVLLYFAFRGGFFSGSAQTTAINPYGIAALAGLAGLFSKQATDKLREVFETLFRVAATKGDAERQDDLANAVPTVSSLEPSHVQVGATAVKLRITGSNFLESVSVVKVNGANQETQFVSPQELDLTLPDTLLAQEGSLEVTVFNGPPGGGESHPPAILAVVPAAQMPVADSEGTGARVSLSPADGAANTSFEVVGEGFSAGESVSIAFDTTPLTTATADDQGSFTQAQIVPPDAGTGSHTISATGTESARVAEAAFNVS